MKYIKKFNTDAEYQAAKYSLELPNVSYCVKENEVHYNPLDYSLQYLTFEAVESGTFSFTKNGTGNDIQYSLDNGLTWTTLASETNTPTVSAGSKILWKATLTPSNPGIGKFSSSGEFKVEGNIMSLLYGDDFEDETSLSDKNYVFYELFAGCTTTLVSAENLSLPATTLGDGCYAGMFYGCTSLRTAPQLPATTLADYCYYQMFYGCSSLTTAPQLPATTLAEQCYYGMFCGCTGLTTAPQLPATTLAGSCYDGMFEYCTSLTNAPKLPATSLAGSCYQYMFQGCTSLTTAPELPATTLTRYCYAGMFYGCTRLTTAPELPAETLANACYSSMFRGCTGLTTAPVLPATTLTSYCYQYMFYGCTGLNYIKCLATVISASYCTTNWVYNVPSTGTFVKASGMTSWGTGIHGIPSGWTIVDA